MRRIYPVLDIVRFMAATVVMLYHLFFWRNGKPPEPAHSVEWFWRFGWVGVEIFFTLSGLVIALTAKQSTALRFLVNRIVRLGPTVWICATATLVGTLLLSSAYDPRRLFLDYFWTLFLRPVGTYIDVVYWTLTVEVAFYSVLLICLWIFNFRLFIKVLIVVGTISTVFNSGLALLPYIDRASPHLGNAILRTSEFQTSNLLLLRHGCFFALGMLIWSLEDELRPRFARALICLFAIGGTMEVWYNGQYERTLLKINQPYVGIAITAWFVGLGAILVARLLPAKRMEPGVNFVSVFRYLGLLTFPIYLLHNNLGLLIESRINQAGAGMVASSVLASTAILILSCVVTSVLEPPFARTLKARLTALIQA